MIDMIPCSECKQCNRKGKPSISRGSKYCNEHIISNKNTGGLFKWVVSIKDRLLEKRWDDKKQEIKTTKGFRKDWWYR